MDRSTSDPCCRAFTQLRCKIDKVSLPLKENNQSFALANDSTTAKYRSGLMLLTFSATVRAKLWRCIRLNKRNIYRSSNEKLLGHFMKPMG